MTQGRQPLLEIKSLQKQFRLGGSQFGAGKIVRAVDGVDLSLYRDESLAIVGESGSGKSTLARCIAGLTRPSSGGVFYDGANVWRLPGGQWKAFRRQVQPIFQDPFSSLDPRWPIDQTIREGLDALKIGSRADRKARVAWLMEQVGLPPQLAGRRPHELSGGQCQRVGIAAALALQPSVLVADEPVSALDVSVRAQVINLLARLRKELGLTLLLITHDLALVEHVCDRTAVMYLGRIVEIGQTRELISAPVHPYTRALVEAIPHPDPARRMRGGQLRGEVPSATSPPSGCRFHPRCPIAITICSSVDPGLMAAGDGRVAACLVEAPRFSGKTNWSDWSGAGEV